MKAVLSQSESLTKVLNSLYKSRLPGSVSKKVLYIVLEFEKASADFTKKKSALQEKHGEKTEKGELKVEDGKAVFTPENRLKFNKDYEALCNKNVAIGLLSQSDIDSLSEISGEELKILLDAGLISAN